MDNLMYNIFNTDLICPNCGEGHIIREEPKVIKSNTERYTYLCTDCGFVHTAKSDEDMMKWIKSLDKPIEEEILKEQVKDFIEIVKETTDYHTKQDYGKAKLSFKIETANGWYTVLTPFDWEDKDEILEYYYIHDVFPVSRFIYGSIDFIPKHAIQTIHIEEVDDEEE